MLSGTNCLDSSIAGMTVPLLVMPGLVPGIHVFKISQKQRLAGTSPAMTINA